MIEITPRGYRRSRFDEPQTKICEWCGEEFQIIWKSDVDKRFCNRSCSAKWRMNQPEYKAKVHTKETHEKIGKKISIWLNTTEKGQKNIDRIRNLKPMEDESCREKVSKTLREIHHKPKVRGGNGKGMTIPQQILFETLKGDWIPELAISLGKRQEGYPTCYKVDLGNDSLMIGIEVDGNTHHSRKEQDKKKDEKLSELGWKVIRFWNDEVMDWNNNGKPIDHFVTKTLMENGIQIRG